MLRFSAKKPSFEEKTRFLFVFCTFFLYEPIGLLINGANSQLLIGSLLI